MTAKRFALWAAVSSRPQLKGVSIDEQLRLGREHADKHNASVIAELIIPGESRSIVLFEEACRKMQAYQQFYDLIRSKSFDVLTFLNRGRLGRDAALSMAIVSLCHKHGVIPYDLEDPPHSLDDYRLTGDKLIVGALKSARDQNETMEIARRHAMGMVARVHQGDFPNRVPWGWIVRYEIAEGQAKPVRIVETDPLAQRILEIIADEYLNHSAGNRAISEMLNDLKLPSPSGVASWDKATVQHIISRAIRYAGYMEYNKANRPGRPYVKAKSKWPALISEELADALLTERIRRQGARRSVGSLHRFSQCVWCDLCQRRMIAEHTYSLNKKDSSIRYPRDVYRCLQDNQVPHPGATISVRKIVAEVRQAIALIRDLEQRRLILVEAPNLAPVIQTEIARLERLIEDQRTALLRADDAHVRGVMDIERYDRQIAIINAQTAAYQKELEQLRTELIAEEHASRKPQRLADLAEHGPAMLETDDIPAANAWFRSRLRIWVRDSEVFAVDYL